MNNQTEELAPASAQQEPEAATSSDWLQASLQEAQAADSDTADSKDEQALNSFDPMRPTEIGCVGGCS